MNSLDLAKINKKKVSQISRNFVKKLTTSNSSINRISLPANLLKKKY